MSSLSSKTFHLKEISESAASKLRSGGSAFIPTDLLQFFDWLQRVQEAKKPRIIDIELLSFVGDHGVAKEFNVPRLKIERKILDTLKQDESISLLIPATKFQHHWVDLGLEYQFESDISYWLNHSNRLINSKVKRGTESFSSYPAMTDNEMISAFYNGRKLIERAHYQGRDLMVFHSGGEGQALSFYILSWALSLKDAQYWPARFPDTLSPAVCLELEKFAKKHPISHDPFTNLCFYGGLETAALCGAMIRCAEKGLPFLLSDPMSLLAWQYTKQMLPGMQNYGYAIGSFCDYLNSDFPKIPELMLYTQEGGEWQAFLAKCVEGLRYFNQ